MDTDVAVFDEVIIITTTGTHCRDAELCTIVVAASATAPHVTPLDA